MERILWVGLLEKWSVKFQWPESQGLVTSLFLGRKDILFFNNIYLTKSLLRDKDSSPTRILETVHRQNRRQFIDIFEDSTPQRSTVLWVLVKKINRWFWNKIVRCSLKEMERNVRSYCLCCLCRRFGDTLDKKLHHLLGKLKVNIMFVNFLTTFCCVPQMPREDEIKKKNI